MAQKQEPIIIDKTINVPKEEVFPLLVEGDGLAKWFPLSAETEPVIGGHFSFTFEFMNPTTHERYNNVLTGNFVDIEKNKKVRYTWGPSKMDPTRNTEVTFTLNEHEGKTDLHFEHTGFDASKDADPAYEQTLKGWVFFLANLKSVLEEGKDNRVTG